MVMSHLCNQIHQSVGTYANNFGIRYLRTNSIIISIFIFDYSDIEDRYFRLLLKIEKMK